ncbi:F-box/LRR-repeat protein [Rhynchospora pubera]|uniref:F-box/LRR-repeat protein n=1 Tax=Rhynchospora pubera TaxID=906938 RepID=A0AAV8ESJ6_9POAL|nr:F-box/LRR-repeat protein [Rhynchospora pubera]KAJ4781052.1 F-box/LRR-repeat protein [Rhynchospora pubera]KAJ4787983.1 F-box/LRR-repeat protein [Rhynchospora pubera]
MEEERRWEDMDTDCLVNIFRRLGLEDLTLAVPFVCRSWYRASLDPTCWRVLKFRGLDFMPWSNLSKEFSNRYGLPGRFSFSGFLKFCVARSHGESIEVELPLLFGATLNDLTYISLECPKLKKAVLPNLQTEDEPHLPEIIGRWHELEQLEMECKPSSFQELVDQLRQNCTKLVSLKLYGSFKNDDVSATVSKLPKIKRLCLSKSYLPKDKLLAILTGCKCLHELIVKDCVGFEVDEEVSKRVLSAGIKIFEHEGSKLVDEFGYETDECDPLYVHAI